jgi:hypothetical protein
MRVGNSYHDVCIRDISSRGMMLQAAIPPGPGTYIEILRAAHIVVARVVWVGERRFGIRAQDRMNIPAIIAAVAPGAPRLPGQERRTQDRVAAPPMRAADIAQAAERSRLMGRAFQFGLLGFGGLISAGMLSTAAFEVLASPFQSAASHLVSN